jgi:hypothetical protein
MRRWLLTCIVLAGCASQPTQAPIIEPGRYADYRAYLSDQMGHLKWRSVPDSLQADLRSCLIDIAFQNFTPAEVSKLDAYAQGKAQMSLAELKELSAEVDRREGVNDGTVLEVARAQCPQTIASIEPYSKSPDFKLTIEP